MSDTKKAPLDLVPLRALVGASRVFAHGNTKTIDGKQREPGDFIERKLDGVFYASTMRHTMELQLLQGVVTADSLAHLDADTDLPTIDHLICNLVIIRAMLIRDGKLPIDPGPGRPKTNPTQDVDGWEEAARKAADKAARDPMMNTVVRLDEKPESDPDTSNYEPVAGMRW